MSARSMVRGVVCSWMLLLVSAVCFAAPWVPTGPDGGDARRIVSDPHDTKHLYLGTENGWLYESHNTGASWQRLVRLGKRDDLVLDWIVMDPRDSKHITIGAWVIGSPDGGVYISHDGGVSFTAAEAMRGQSVRALAESRSNPDVLVAGTLQGVFESSDDGQNWTQISPKGSTELHEFESIAIDPADPKVIYAGTWHLPWKTTDGGKTWANIKQGIIDDSDVFSIIVDPAAPATVYASACSGIYKSVDAGQQFKKVQGIPSTARRTRVLLQDPTNPAIVFAGTTEGLWRTTDAGAKWSRLTGPEVIVNDVWVSPADSKLVMLATDRQGVQVSTDGGDTFKPSNSGFSARQITSVLRDRKSPDRVWVGVVNDKQAGGVFQSDDGAASWKQVADGLDGHDVFSLGQAADGTVVAGTAHGIYLLNGGSEHWTRMSAELTLEPLPVAPQPAVEAGTDKAIAPPVEHPSGKKLTPKERRVQAALERRRALAAKRKSAAEAKSEAGKHPGAHSKSVAATVLTPKVIEKIFDGPVYAIALAGQRLLAATSLGLLKSDDNGSSWQLLPDSGRDWQYLAANGKTAVAASGSVLTASTDGGVSWSAAALPAGLTQVSSVAVDSTGEIWMGGPDGDFVSSDGGKAWDRPKGMFTTSIADIDFDEYFNRINVATRGPNSMVFTLQLRDKLVVYTHAGWNLRLVRQVAGGLIGSTTFDGIVTQPKADAGDSSAAQTTRTQPPVAASGTPAPKPSQE